MYAVISLAGHQHKVKEGDKLELNFIESEVGESIITDQVLALFDESGKVELGMPTVPGKAVELKILEHKKGDKIRVYKMKAKKRYRRNKGFRPTLTIVEVVSLSAKPVAAKPAKKVAKAADAAVEA